MNCTRKKYNGIIDNILPLVVGFCDVDAIAVVAGVPDPEATAFAGVAM